MNNEVKNEELDSLKQDIKNGEKRVVGARVFSYGLSVITALSAAGSVAGGIFAYKTSQSIHDDELLFLNFLFMSAICGIWSLAFLNDTIEEFIDLKNKKNKVIDSKKKYIDKYNELNKKH